MEKPGTSKFLDELRSINCKLANPVAAIIPKRTQNMPPIIGSGMVMKREQNLDKIPKSIIIKALSKKRCVEKGKHDHALKKF